ncbi:MAG TPA: LuxR C-terminal-related transcriptional regulator [Candidatus Eisenbacteria bacterium]|nr:LuxR C-terminal-related transcriptional regulator [Candidatus Eisenbacteria bacterium]
MPTTPARPGLIVADSAFAVLACNPEALRILSYPDRPDNTHQSDTWLSSKVRSTLIEQTTPLRIVERFRSARRTYLCRSFTLEVKKPTNNGSGQNAGLHVVLLERRSNHTVRLNELSQRFGLTAREQETVENLLEGMTSKEIAQRMNISPNTVKAFLRLTMVKMNVSTRSGIIGRIIGDS